MKKKIGIIVGASDVFQGSIEIYFLTGYGGYSNKVIDLALKNLIEARYNWDKEDYVHKRREVEHGKEMDRIFGTSHQREFDEPKPTKGVLERELGYARASFNPNTKRVTLRFDGIIRSKNSLFAPVFPFFRRIAVKQAKKAFPAMTSLVYVNPLTRRKKTISNKSKSVRRRLPVKTRAKPSNRRPLLRR